MAQYFFTGGIMPSEQILELFQDKLVVEKHWAIRGRHYGRTCRQWLENLDGNRESIIDIFRQCYGHEAAQIWLQRWRIFFMACEELFNFHGGTEWFVSHTLMKAP
jgi:cyclopropane-fatty-acyl-phospholipid synthase